MGLVLGVLTDQLAILETMAPADYHVVRLALGRGSGQDSPGFNQMLKIGEPLWQAFQGVRPAELTLLELHQHPEAHYDLFLLMQALMDLDERFVRWRFCHFQLVRRVIGEDVKSLKGIPAAQLVHGMREYLFPELWAVVNEVTKATNPKY
jgi:tryptophan 2,3-dioxygenase